MRKITVVYWMGVAIQSMGIEHNTQFDYSEEKRNEIIDLALENRLQVMLYNSDDVLIIWIDNGRFRQR